MLVGALAVAALWGATPVIHKHVLDNVDAPFVLVLGGMAYVACLVAYALWHRSAISRQWSCVSYATLAWIAAASIFTGFLAHLLYFAVLPQEPSHVVSSLIYAGPLFTLLYATVFLHESVSVWSGVGTGLVVAGVCCLAAAPSATSS